MNDKMGDQMDYLMNEISRLRKNRGINHGRISMMKNINVDISRSTSSIVESLSDGDDDDIYENDDDDYDDYDSYNDTTTDSNNNDEEDTSLTKKDIEGGNTGDLQCAISTYPQVDIERERGSPTNVMTQTEHLTEKPTSDGLLITNHEEAAPINQLNEATPINSTTLAIMKVYKSIRSRRNMTSHHVQQYQRYVDRRARMVHQQAKIDTNIR
jgi:hypothetical protein